MCVDFLGVTGLRMVSVRGNLYGAEASQGGTRTSEQMVTGPGLGGKKKS